MKFGLKEIVLVGGLLFGASKVSGQEFLSREINPWNYEKELFIEADLNDDGIKDRFVAVDSAGLKGYDYRIFTEIKNEKEKVLERKELSRTNGMVYNLKIDDGKLIYYVNHGVNLEGNFCEPFMNIQKRQGLYEKREFDEMSKKFVCTDVSEENPDL